VVAGFLMLSYRNKLQSAGTAGVTSEMSALTTHVAATLVYREQFWIATTLAVASMLLLELKGALEGLTQQHRTGRDLHLHQVPAAHGSDSAGASQPPGHFCCHGNGGGICERASLHQVAALKGAAFGLGRICKTHQHFVFTFRHGNDLPDSSLRIPCRFQAPSPLAAAPAFPPAAGRQILQVGEG